MSESMQALVLHAVGDIRCQTVPRPRPGAGQVLVRVGFCGVCGSDIPRVFVKGTYRFPLIPGHEMAGTVEACGADVRGIAAGDRVVVFPLLWCGKCPACEQGKFVQCADYDYLGSRCDGGFAQYVVAPPRNLVKIPAGVEMDEAAMAEPAAVALHALKRIGKPLTGEDVAIFGAGPIGLLVARWARAMGSARVIVFDVVERNLALARLLGFEFAFDSRQHDAVRTVNGLTDGQGAGVCIDAAGVAPTILAALQATRRGGSAVLLGNPAGDVSVPASLLSQVMRREVNILGTWNSDYSPAGNSDDWHTALLAMSRGTLRLKPLITHRLSLDQGVDGLEMMRDRREFCCKVMIEP